MLPALFHSAEPIAVALASDVGAREILLIVSGIVISATALAFTVRLLFRSPGAGIQSTTPADVPCPEQPARAPESNSPAAARLTDVTERIEQIELTLSAINGRLDRGGSDGLQKLASEHGSLMDVLRWAPIPRDEHSAWLHHIKLLACMNRCAGSSLPEGSLEEVLRSLNIDGKRCNVEPASGGEWELAPDADGSWLFSKLRLLPVSPAASAPPEYLPVFFHIPQPPSSGRQVLQISIASTLKQIGDSFRLSERGVAEWVDAIDLRNWDTDVLVAARDLKLEPLLTAVRLISSLEARMESLARDIRSLTSAARAWSEALADWEPEYPSLADNQALERVAAHKLRRAVNSYRGEFPRPFRPGVLKDVLMYLEKEGLNARVCEIVPNDRSPEVFHINESSEGNWVAVCMPSGRLLVAPLDYRSQDEAGPEICEAYHLLRRPCGTRLEQVCEFDEYHSTAEVFSLKRRGNVVNPSDIASLTPVLKARLELLAESILTRADARTGVLLRDTSRPWPAPMGLTSEPPKVDEAPTLPYSSEEFDKAWAGLPSGWWMTVMNEVQSEAAGASPEEYFDSVQRLAGILSEWLGRHTTGHEARIIQLTDSGDGRLACDHIAIDNGSPRNSKEQILTGRELFQLFVALESTDRRFAAVMLPAGSFQVNRHPLVLTTLIENPPDHSVTITGLAEPAFLYRSDDTLHELIRPMKLVVERYM